MRKVSNQVQRISKVRFSTSSTTAPNDDDVPQKRVTTLQEDLQDLQKDFRQQFACLQEEVRSDLSRAHFNVGTKVRQYSELMMVRQQKMVEKMIAKSGMPGVAEPTLSGARQDLALPDKPQLDEVQELPEIRTSGTAFAFDDDEKTNGQDHVSTWGIYNEDERPKTAYGNDARPKTAHGMRLDKVSTLLPGINHDEHSIARQMRFQDEVSAVLSGTNHDADGGIKKQTVRFQGPSKYRENDIQIDDADLTITAVDSLRFSTASEKSEADGKEGRGKTVRFDVPAAVNGTQKSRIATSEKERDSNVPPLRATDFLLDRGSLVEADCADEGEQPLSRIAKIERSKAFDIFAATILVGNAIFIGIAIDNTTPDGKPPLEFTLIDLLFTISFLAELVVRMAAAESVWRYFTKPGEWSWNWFDFLVTSFAVVDALLSLISQDSANTLSNMRVIRVLRVLRMIRVVRIIRVMRFFRSLRILIAAILGTVRSGMWTAGLLTMIVYLFALVFAQGAIDHLLLMAPEEELSESEIADKRALWKFFGTLPRSIFTLWMSIVGGIDWQLAALALSDVSPFYVGLFVFYIALLCLAVLNVVAGLFLQTAMEQAQSDMQDVAVEVRQQRQWYTSLITDIFSHADKDGDGVVSLREFEGVVTDPKMTDFLDLLGLQVSDAWTLYRLLDLAGTGVDADDFVEGCLRMRGHARSLDIAQLMYESKWMRDELFEIHSFLRLKFEGTRVTAVREPWIDQQLQ